MRDPEIEKTPLRSIGVQRGRQLLKSLDLLSACLSRSELLLAQRLKRHVHLASLLGDRYELPAQLRIQSVTHGELDGLGTVFDLPERGGNRFIKVVHVRFNADYAFPGNRQTDLLSGWTGI